MMRTSCERLAEDFAVPHPRLVQSRVPEVVFRYLRMYPRCFQPHRRRIWAVTRAASVLRATMAPALVLQLLPWQLEPNRRCRKLEDIEYQE